MTRPTPPANWADASYERHYLAIAGRLILVATLEADALVTDLYQDPESDRPTRVLPVVSVRRGVSLATAEPFIPPGWQALAWECELEPDPRARLVRASLQGHLRARERLTDETGLVPMPRQ